MSLRNPFAIRRSEGTVPTLAVGGSPLPEEVPPPVVLRVFRCPDCAFTSPDPEVAFVHVMSGHRKGVAA